MGLALGKILPAWNALRPQRPGILNTFVDKG
jgi:hypothetical protein